VLGPIILAIFVHSGSLKSHPLLLWVPIDLTVLLGIFLVGCAFAEVARARYISRAMWVPLLIGSAMLLGIGNIQTAYGSNKAMSFFAITFLGIVSAVILLCDSKQRRAFLGALAGLGIAVTLLLILAPERTAEWSTVVTLSGTNTISTSQMIVAGAAVLGMFAITSRTSTPRRLSAAVAALAMFYAALSTGSRGPVVAIGASLAIALLLAPVFSRRRARVIIAILVVGGIGATVAIQQGGEGLARVVGFLAGDQDTSTSARVVLWSTAWNHITQLPGGGGWGYFGTAPELTFIGVRGIAQYPHNVPLEITLEAGWAAGIFFALLLLGSGIRMVKRAVDPPSVMMLVLLIFTVINSMLSGDINDNRLMWVLVTAAWLIPVPTSQNDETPPTLTQKSRAGGERRVR